MKKAFKSALILLLAAAAVFAAWQAGRRSGIAHTLGDVEFLITSLDAAYTEPDGTEYDTELHITLDGQEYIQGLWIG